MEKRRAPYENVIIKTLAAISITGFDPRHIEAWMRLEYGTLDHISGNRWNSEVKMAIDCIREAGIDRSESLAHSYGL